MRGRVAAAILNRVQKEMPDTFIEIGEINGVIEDFRTLAVSADNAEFTNRRIRRREDADKGKGECEAEDYSHSMVLGGLLEMSKHTRLTPLTSLMIRVLIRAIKS